LVDLPQLKSALFLKEFKQLVQEGGLYVVKREVYVKLKIAQVGTHKIAKCISFHAAQQPLCYPFK